MAPHSSTLAWKIPWMEEPGRLQSMGSRRVGHNWATSRSLFTFMHWRRKWQPTPVFLPGESQGRGSLVCCRLWGCRVGHEWSDLAAVAAATAEVIKTIWRTGEVWFTFLRSWKKMFLVWGPDLLSNNAEGSLAVFDFYKLFAAIYSTSFSASPLPIWHRSKTFIFSAPQLKYHSGKAGLITFNCSHRPCFITFMAFTIIWNYWTYLSVPAFIVWPLPPHWNIQDCPPYSLLIITSPTPPPTTPRRA